MILYVIIGCTVAYVIYVFHLINKHKRKLFDVGENSSLESKEYIDSLETPIRPKGLWERVRPKPEDTRQMFHCPFHCVDDVLRHQLKETYRNPDHRQSIPNQVATYISRHPNQGQGNVLHDTHDELMNKIAKVRKQFV